VIRKVSEISANEYDCTVLDRTFKLPGFKCYDLQDAKGLYLNE
jgi:hypothetical protein